MRERSKLDYPSEMKTKRGRTVSQIVFTSAGRGLPASKRMGLLWFVFLAFFAVEFFPARTMRERSKLDRPSEMKTKRNRTVFRSGFLKRLSRLPAATRTPVGAGQTVYLFAR